MSEQRYAWCPAAEKAPGIDIRGARWLAERYPRPVLMSDTHLFSEAPILALFPKDRRWTRRSRAALSRGVLLYEADWPVLAEGLTHVEDDGFAVALESSWCPLGGWARSVGALNLATGETEPPLAADVADAAETIGMLSYNSLGSPPAKAVVPRILGELHSTGSLTWDFPGAVLAAAPSSGRSMDVLTKQLERLIGRRPGLRF